MKSQEGEIGQEKKQKKDGGAEDQMAFPDASEEEGQVQRIMKKSKRRKTGSGCSPIDGRKDGNRCYRGKKRKAGTDKTGHKFGKEKIKQ